MYIDDISVATIASFPVTYNSNKIRKYLFYSPVLHIMAMLSLWIFWINFNNYVAYKYVIYRKLFYRDSASLLLHSNHGEMATEYKL